MPYPSYVHYAVTLEIEGADEFQQPLSKQHGSGLFVSRIAMLVHALGYLLKVGSHNVRHSDDGHATIKHIQKFVGLHRTVFG